MLPPHSGLENTLVATGELKYHKGQFIIGSKTFPYESFIKKHLTVTNVGILLCGILSVIKQASDKLMSS